MGDGKSRRFKRIACVQLEPRYPDFCSRVIMPRYGLPVIGALLQREGYEVKVFIEHIGPVDREWILGADVILLSALTGAATRTYEFADWLRRHTDAPIVLGGEHGSSFANDSLEWVDYVVRREGDATIVELLHALEEGRPASEIAGISYMRDGEVVHNDPGEVPDNINVTHDLDIIHGYPKEDGLRLMLKRGMAKLICVQATRGCPYRCSFCVAPRLFGYTYRFRDIEVVIDDVRRKLAYGRNFLFVDNLFALNERRTNALLDRMIEEGFGKRAAFTIFCRVEISEQPEMLEKMYRAGVRTICLGLESINNLTLEGINKQQKLSDMVAAITAIRRAGICPSGSFIAGNDGDTRESLLDTARFAISSDLNSFYFISLWYYPGDPRCPLIPQRQIVPSYDYCTGHFVTHFPSHMRPSTLQRTIVDAQRIFWNRKRALKLALRGEFADAMHLFTHRVAFNAVERHQLAHANYLESIEQGYYDQDERLIMSRIRKREPDPIVKRARAAGEVKLDSAKDRRSAIQRNAEVEQALAAAAAH
jgi:anaerobic magnesium-protoporphyrin IX monomethyl ester cyclase